MRIATDGSYSRSYVILEGMNQAPDSNGGNSSDSSFLPPIVASPGWIPPDMSPPRRRSIFKGRIRLSGPRRRVLPMVLFLVTCLSTLFAGAAVWNPAECLLESFSLGSLMPVRRAFVAHGMDGLIYMACVLAILLTHEMGHFLATLKYHIPASFPYFLPLPISPIGTLGAVIGMDGLRANRKEMFDIGLAGPLAGLVVAVPIMIVGIQQMDLTTSGAGIFRLDLPLAMVWTMQWLHVPGYRPGLVIDHSQLNPFFMAGWVGLLITGLNMMPVSQLDGGHVTYTLFGRRAHWLARAFMLFAVAYIVFAGVYGLALMVLLIMLIGTDHPPTRDDSVPLGWPRVLLGSCSLLIPILCFPPRVILT